MTSILVLGTGSIGKRHIKNILAAGIPAEDLFVVEPRADRRAEAAAIGVLPANTFETRAAALAARKFDGAVVATPTSMHYDDAIDVARHGIALMIEKPMGIDMGRAAELRAEVERQGIFCFVAYCFRFDPTARRFAQALAEGAIGKPLYARAEMSTYLPEWHPHERYQDFYMSKLALGGGTLLDQSHLYDMTRWFLGDVETVFGLSRRESDLEIETDDFGEFLFGMASGIHASIHIDLYTRPWREFYQVSGETGTLEWDIHNKTITLGKTDGSRETLMSGADYNQMYVNEIGYFLDRVRGKSVAGPGFDDGWKVMEIIEAIRASNGQARIRL